jgi:S1-C subfamily serine protease
MALAVIAVSAMVVALALFVDHAVDAHQVSGVAARVDPGLVDVNTDLALQNAGAAGTGLVLTSAGEILTNNHVIDGGTSISVRDIGNGQTYHATLIGDDITADIAVLQVDGAPPLTTVKLGTSVGLGVGTPVIAIGNAGGLGGTPSVTTGTVTQLDQSIQATNDGNGLIERLTGLIQTDAALQPGDSGGPLVNDSGEVVGMDTAAATGLALRPSPDQAYAIPIVKALSVAAQIEAGHASDLVHVGPTAFLGVEIESSAASQSASAGGAIISGVVPNTPAAGAGLAGGDVITGIGGRTVGSEEELTTVLQTLSPGAKVTVQWLDPSGIQHSATVQLTTGPAQ